MRTQTNLTYEHKQARFLKYLPGGFNDKDCWEWQGPLLNNGYGDFELRARNNPNYYRERAHRFSFMHFNEMQIPEGMFVCHKCDNPKCCNPLHLFLGTAKDNVQDAIQKARMFNTEQRQKQRFRAKEWIKSRQIDRLGRLIGNGQTLEEANARPDNQPKGEKHSKLMKEKSLKGDENAASKLTSDNVREIFNLRKQGWFLWEIAARFDVNTSTICKITKGRRWKHLHEEVT